MPTQQTCCGQPAYNSGDKATARELARQTIAAFEAHDYVVAPSGSCAGMLKAHYPELLAGDPAWKERDARSSRPRCTSWSRSWSTCAASPSVDARLEARATYHDSCSGLRELGVREQPRKLLRTVKGLELVELVDADVCCGFGGTFSIKYPEISNSIVESKAQHVAATGADMLLAGDLGCLMNMAGKLSRQGRRIAVRHVAEVLAGELSDPPIGEAAQ